MTPQFLYKATIYLFVGSALLMKCTACVSHLVGMSDFRKHKEVVGSILVNTPINQMVVKNQPQLSSLDKNIINININLTT